MKTLALLLSTLALATSALAADLKSIPADRFQAAGLHKLTTKELAELESVFEELKSGEVSAVRKEAEQKVAVVKQEAEQKVAAARQAAEQNAAAAATRSSGPGWFGALLTLQKAGSSASDELQSTLQGTLKNFGGRRSFTFTNGQVWQMIEDGSYAGPTLNDPEVFIRPGIVGTFWLRIPDAGLRVRVKPLKLE
jgi:septal ring-binding cell division protein DamX